MFEDTINSMSGALEISPYAFTALATLLIAIVVASLLYPLTRRKKVEKEKEKKTPEMTPEFLKWVRANFDNLAEFEEFYVNTINTKRKVIEKELWKEKGK